MKEWMISKLKNEINSEEEKTMSPLRQAMGKLDHAIPDYIFDDEDGEELANIISQVWDAIENIESEYVQMVLRENE